MGLLRFKAILPPELLLFRSLLGVFVYPHYMQYISVCMYIIHIYIYMIGNYDLKSSHKGFLFLSVFKNNLEIRK